MKKRTFSRLKMKIFFILFLLKCCNKISKKNTKKKIEKN